jgi:pSer/pThr/pTyr-binding forkhead associated (FHA) protein
MPEQLLTVLKICLLALLYLFFLRVLRAVWAEVSPPKSAPVTTGAPLAGSPRASRSKVSRPGRKVGAATKMTVVEPAALAGREFPLDDEVTIGRAPGCTIVLDEQFVSQVHTRVFRREGAVFVEDLGSTNGTWVNGTRAVGQMPGRPGDRVQIGNVILELR